MRRSTAMFSTWSGSSTGSSVAPGCPFCPPGLRLLALVLGFDPRLRHGSCEGGILLLELLRSSFATSRWMIVTSNSNIARAAEERDRSFPSKSSTLASVLVTLILPTLTGTPANAGSACGADIPALA